MIGKLGKLRIRARASQYLCVPRGEHAAALTLERPAHDRRAATSAASIDNLVNEVNELIWKTYGYLPAHTNMVPNCYQSSGLPPVRQRRARDLSDRGATITEADTRGAGG